PASPRPPRVRRSRARDSSLDTRDFTPRRRTDATTVPARGPSSHTIMEADRPTALDPATPPPSSVRAAWNAVVHAFSFIGGVTRGDKERRARSVVSWMRDQQLVAVDSDRLRFQIGYGSSRLSDRRIRDSFPWMEAWQVGALQNMLASRSAQGGLDEAPALRTLEKDVLYTLYPRLWAR
ncbi:MAG TPA: hypothetical protein VFH51_05835, partial [Myxococcota bacterium]|nr:hypothetical protein [Myxococcota bacterium]